MTDVRFGIKVDSDNGHHVRLRLFAATGGQHLGGCGQLVMTATEYAAFRDLLAPRLADRSDPPAPQVQFAGLSPADAKPCYACDGRGLVPVGDDGELYECRACDGVGGA